MAKGRDYIILNGCHKFDSDCFSGEQHNLLFSAIAELQERLGIDVSEEEKDSMTKGSGGGAKVEKVMERK